VPAWKTIPSWAVVGTADRVILPAVQLAMARHAHARITEVAKRMGATTVAIESGHLAMVSHPDEVAQLIKTAAEAVPAAG
jgi:pimeloyl-ACP methyl ester carboxylesterase